MKEILTPAFIKQKIKTKDEVFQNRINIIAKLSKFNNTRGHVCWSTPTFKEEKQRKETNQNKLVFTECKVTDDLSIHFGHTGKDMDGVDELWIHRTDKDFYYLVDTRLYPILLSEKLLKVKMNDLKVEIKHRTKKFEFQGALDQVLSETFIRLGKHEYKHEVDKFELSYTTRRYKDILILTISPKIYFKPGGIWFPNISYIRSIMTALSRVDELYWEYA